MAGKPRSRDLLLPSHVFTAQCSTLISQQRSLAGTVYWACGLRELMLQLNWKVLSRLNIPLSDGRKSRLFKMVIDSV